MNGRATGETGAAAPGSEYTTPAALTTPASSRERGLAAPAPGSWSRMTVTGPATSRFTDVIASVPESVISPSPPTTSAVAAP